MYGSHTKSITYNYIYRQRGQGQITHVVTKLESKNIYITHQLGGARLHNIFHANYKPHVCWYLSSDYVYQKGTKAAGEKFNFTLLNFPWKKKTTHHAFGW